MKNKLVPIFHKTGNSFEGQEVGEEVALVLRRHPFTIIIPLLFILLIALLPSIVWVYFSEEIRARNYAELFFFAWSLWFLLSWLMSFYLLTLYSLNSVIITNKRIIENEQQGFFRRKVSELHTYRVQDVAVRTHGLFETLLSFGELSVQTAAEEREFVFQQIPHPERVKDAIMKIVASHRSGLGL